jgi:hypothetical protein
MAHTDAVKVDNSSTATEIATTPRGEMRSLHMDPEAFVFMFLLT